MATKPANIERDAAKVTVLINGAEYQGWLQSTVERSLETITGTFSVPISLDPNQAPNIKRQDAVQVRIGGMPVITGYVLASAPWYNKRDVGMRIIGRDRTGDLVRCSAIHAGGQWRQATIDRIAKDLAAPFGVSVVVDADVGAPLADFKIAHGEAVLDCLSRAGRLRGVLITRNDLGQLVITKAGKDSFGAIVRGLNVISMEDIGSDEQRFSEYIAYGQSNTADDFEAARQMKARAVDDELAGRYLPLIINPDGNHTQADLQRLVDHTARVRRGHAYGFRYVVEGWTYQGKPWPLNARVPIWDAVAGLDGDEWLICSVKQTCDVKEGDVTELVVRPIEAYDTVPLKTKVKRRHRGEPAIRDAKHLRGAR